MTLQTIDLSNYYTPHPGQEPIHASDAVVKNLKMGRRYGKSRCALGEMLRRYAEARDTPVPSSLIPPWHAWVVAPSYPQSRQVWNELLSIWPSPFIQSVHQDERMIYLTGTEHRPWGLIEVKSAHSEDSLQTAGLDFLWVTEAQDVSDKAFERLLPTLRSPGRMGYNINEGIPSLYPTHWFERNCRAAEDGRPGYELFHATAFDNPTLTDADRAEMEADRALLPDRAWRRMYLAEFSEDAGYFTNISANIAGDLLSGPIPGGTYVAGMDLGRKVDASVLYIMDAETRQVVHHHAWDQGSEWVLQREGTTRMCQNWGVERLIIDSTGMGGDIFFSELIEAGLPAESFVIGDNKSRTGSRTFLLQQLAVAMERQTVSFPNIPSLLRELRAFQYRRLPGGDFKAEAPPGEHDDEVFALALALTACQAPADIRQAPHTRRRSRYVPTQEEAEAGTFSGAKGRMRDRQIGRIRARQEALGL